MPVMLLLAQALCGVTLYLPAQDALPDVSWPTHATITLPKGWIKPSDQLFVTENGQPIISQIEVLAKWPDGSPKWLHAYASYRYIGGKPAKYELEKRPKLPDAVPKSPLIVTDSPKEIRVQTGALSFVVARPFAGVTMVRVGEQSVLEGPGGPSLVDDRGITWHAMHDETAEVTVEQLGPAQVTIKASGWYQTAERRVAPFCRFVTRITAFANSAMLKFDHATIMADDMRKHAIAEIAFRFPVQGIQGYASGTRQGAFDQNLVNLWFVQATPNRLLTLAQLGPQEPRAADAEETDRRSPGWFSVDAAGRQVVLLTKDIWQKAPKEVQIGADGITYFAWPRHGDLAKPDATATELSQVYKFQCFHTGALLDSRLPGDYFAALEEQTDTSECKAEYARAANMQGVAMRNEFALVFGAGPASAEQSARLQQLYLQNPIARVSPAAMAVSGALGAVAAAGAEFPVVETAVRDGMLGYAASIPRYGDYGWAIYGNTHHAELMNPQAAGVPGGRPSLHRVWSNDHYQHVSTSWRLYALGADSKMLDWARTCTDNYASIGQVRYDSGKGYVDGNGKHIDGPSVKYHQAGGFYHCKALVPWGGRDYGMDKNDVDAALTGHWPDPSGLLMSWLIDANRWAKDGYELWLNNVKFPTGGTRREINTTLVHAITAYEYRPTPEILAAIRGMAQGLSSVPLIQQSPGAIWEPTWLSRYHELAPDDEAFNQYILESADAAGVHIEGIWTLALSATAYRISKDEKYLRQHGGTLARVSRDVFHDSAPDKRWDRYGFSPGPGRDRHFMLQWPWFHAALKDAKIDSLAAPDEPGQYFCGQSRFDNIGDIQAHGTKILIWQPKAETVVTLEATTLSGGDIHATSLQIMAPGGQSLLSVPRLPMAGNTPAVVRPSSWDVRVEKYPIDSAEPGLYTVLIGSHQIGLFQPLTDQPECQVLQRVPPKPAEPVSLLAKLARGYLVPLTDSRIDLTFTALGTSDGSYIGLDDAHGQRLLARYLRSGDSVTVALNHSPDSTGPWLLDAFSDFSGYFRMAIEAKAAEPLLFGRNLADMELIRQKLAR